MNKSQKVKKLLRGYFDRNLTETEREALFYLIHQEDLEEAVFCEQYRIWDESPMHHKNIQSAELFDRIKKETDITGEDLAEGDLKLKGFRYNQLQSRRSKMHSLLKYAAVILITALFSGILFYLEGRLRTKEIARNEISVPYGSRIKVTLADSSGVWLNSGSILSYPDRFSESNREVHLTGEAFFDIRERTGQPFYVRTSDIDIKVLGTRFNVKSYPEEDIIETTLVTGQLVIEPKATIAAGRKEAVLYSNQKAYYSKKVKKLALVNMESVRDQKKVEEESSNLVNIKSPEKIQQLAVETSWTENRLVFRDESFSSLAKRLERWYNVEITIRDREVGELKFTGSIENETIEQVMEAFSYASRIDYSIDHNKIEITRKRK